MSNLSYVNKLRQQFCKLVKQNYLRFGKHILKCCKVVKTIFNVLIVKIGNASLNFYVSPLRSFHALRKRGFKSSELSGWNKVSDIPKVIPFADLSFKSHSHRRQNCFICVNESHLKMTKNAFYFILKALFVLKILKFFSRLFVHVERVAWLERSG